VSGRRRQAMIRLWNLADGTEVRSDPGPTTGRVRGRVALLAPDGPEAVPQFRTGGGQVKLLLNAPASGAELRPAWGDKRVPDRRHPRDPRAGPGGSGPVNRRDLKGGLPALAAWTTGTPGSARFPGRLR